MPEFRRAIFTIHGINSNGSWQREAADVLEPHFRCPPLPYSQFRHLGWPKILIDWLRKRAVKTVARRLSGQVGPAERSHLIAHSFGTWIAAELMKRPRVLFDRVVFAGSPLPCDFDWKSELADNPEAFRDLANEYGGRDGVIALAGLAGGACAGEVGFRSLSEPIHDTHAFRVSCPQCRGLPEAEQARIHNLEWKDFEHSGWFVGNGHSANLWLPYFWGIAPEEYGEFIDACLRLAEMESRGDLLNRKPEETTFRARGWSWTRRGQTALSLNDYVEESVGEYLECQGRPRDPRAIQNIRQRAIRLVWVNVADAIEERRKPAGRREHIVRRLHPQIAILAAIDGAAAQYPWTSGG